MKIKNFFILLLACALLFAGCKVETDAPIRLLHPLRPLHLRILFYTERILFESAHRHMKNAASMRIFQKNTPHSSAKQPMRLRGKRRFTASLSRLHTACFFPMI